MAFKIYSPAFKNNGLIPKKYTCEGANVSPPLKWRGVPKGAVSFALVVEDPDGLDPKAPKMAWDHWVLYNILGDKRELKEDYGDLPFDSCQGINSWQKIGDGGPCRPAGRHRYVCKFLPLKTIWKLLASLVKKSL
ncbi:MAG: YbhB/YbcL family Raf kinase inhibitor-like protein [Halobacteriovoraceae bacterium]|nr:YbhB/YbcL family Raf kinase inhibitor-like protein [Halobacteriovoraceae bacterium]